MKVNQLAAVLATTFLAGSTAFAAGPTNAEYFPFPEGTTAAIVRTSTGAPVTSATSTDAKTMGAQASPDDRSAEILMYLKAGS